MKKLVLTLTATLACVAAFGQGKVSFRNDSLHLVYYTTDTSHLGTADAAFAGQAVPLGAAISFDLFAGTAAGSLSKVTTTTMNTTGTPGSFGPMSVILPFAAGSAFFEITAYTTTAGSEAGVLADAGQHTWYYGDTGVFTATSGGSLTYNSLVATGSPSFSTWAVGGYSMDSVLPGAKGALMIQTVPEPTSLALIGLGAAGLMIFRRRK